MPKKTTMTFVVENSMNHIFQSHCFGEINPRKKLVSCTKAQRQLNSNAPYLAKEMITPATLKLLIIIRISRSWILLHDSINN